MLVTPAFKTPYCLQFTPRTISCLGFVLSPFLPAQPPIASLAAAYGKFIETLATDFQMPISVCMRRRVWQKNETK